MAIKKSVTADNGVITDYHRVALITIDVNNQNTILVHSYLKQGGRQIEKDYAAGEISDDVKWPYVDTQYIHTDYDGFMTIEKAYEYLKTLPIFEGAEDC